VDERSNQLAPFADAVLEPGKDFTSILQQLSDGIQAAKLGDKTDLGKAVSFIRSAEKIVLIIGKLPANVSSEKVSTFEKTLRSKSKSLDVISLKGQANSYASYLFGLEKPVDLKGFKTIFVFQGDEEIDQKLAKELEQIPNLVIQSTFVSGLTSKAQIVLPAPTWSECDGTFISADGRIQLAQRVINPTEDTISTVEVLRQIGTTIGTKLAKDWKTGLDATRVVTNTDLK
jgi:NADH dehydrogenase/NADH:ubiquinone oxidoreductase subunit G